MELHQLRYFVAVADLQSFTRAAERCLVAQPSLSQQIIKLERELRQPLFQRLGRSVQLTEAGQTLYQHAVAVLSNIEDMKNRLAATTDPLQGTIRIGAIPTVAPYLLPPLLKVFARRFPKAKVALQENLTEFTVRGCLEGDLDLGVIATVTGHEQLASEALFTEELMLALPPKHPLLKKKHISLEAVAKEPFILLDELHCLGEQVIDFCNQQGCMPAVRCRSAQLLTVQELVALGHGVSIVPAMVSQMDRGRRCQYRSLTAPRPVRILRMIWHKARYQTSLVKEFADTLRSNQPAFAISPRTR